MAEADPPFRLVVIGANGSGKTRFGIWLEEHNQGRMTVQRVSAQKALNIPEFVSMLTLEQAEKDLRFGRHDEHASLARKLTDRWGDNPATFLLSDYDKLLALLFAKEAERNRQHTEQTRQASQYFAVPDSPIDQIMGVWSYLMPHRTIAFLDGKVVVGKGSPSEHHAKEMSDGERVTLYLLGQCLCAPTGSMLIIDEPELHLHRSLMDKLWNKIEELCADKTLVYITHDLDFAASRAGARKIWIQDFSGSAWTWVDIPIDDALPEALILEIIGNRKPLLFCEGERGGLDHTIYQLCFPHLHVVPRGGSEKVIESTKALRANGAFHFYSAKGIVDRDIRNDGEIVELERQGVHVLKFAEVENLLCTESLVGAVAAQMSLDAATTIASVELYIREALNSELDMQIVMRAERSIRYHLSRYSRTTPDESGLQQGLNDLLNTLNVNSAIAEARATFANAIASAGLNELLKVYNRKSIVDRISSCFGLATCEYPVMVIRLLKGTDGKTFTAHLKNELPAL
ncbi:MAG TPA: AAA family ATPase [Chthoniobacterales bacterium]